MYQKSLMTIKLIYRENSICKNKTGYKYDESINLCDVERALSQIEFSHILKKQGEGKNEQIYCF